jgi:hypothetical protein
LNVFVEGIEVSVAAEFAPSSESYDADSDDKILLLETSSEVKASVID